METTNMNNTNTAIETTASENIYIATKVRTEVWEERTEMDVSAFECTSIATLTTMFANSKELDYVVKNPATGEEVTYDGTAICE